MTEIKKLELKHIAPYLPYGLRWRFEGEDITHEVVGLDIIDTGVKLISPYYNYGSCEINNGRPLLRPMSDLYKEINGEVGIVEIAKILSGTVLVDKIDGCCRNLSYFRCTFEDYGCEELIINEKCEGWYRSYFDKNQPNTGRNIIDQFEVYNYLFSHHYDIYGLLDQNIAINKNDIE